jgi:DNA-binding CsgD family transcriptional regulator
LSFKSQNEWVEGGPGDQVEAAIVGRDRELEHVARFLSGGAAGACLVLAGNPGIGKTTLWQAGIRSAQGNNFRALWTRASEGEAAMLFAGLADLMDGLDEAVLNRIPSPQAHALGVALRRVNPDHSPPEPFAISSGFLNAIREAAKTSRLLIAVDDVQWLDPSSADCLLFVARRLKGEDVSFLLSRRGEGPTDLERVLEPHGVERLQVGGLSMGAVSRLLSERLGLTVPRRVLRQLYETSQGNCLFALELARLVRERGVPDVGFDLPVSKMVEEVFAARVRALETPVRHALLAVALSPGLTRRELASVVDPLAVEEALHAGLLVLDRGRLRPDHPMYAASVLSDSTAAERQDTHLALAGVVRDEVLSARHVAMATVAPDAGVADTVSAAARTALERGAFSEAETLAAHALRLTPSEVPERADRLLELVQSHLRAGDYPGAATALGDQIASLAPGRQRALGHFLLAEGSSGPNELVQLDLAMAEAPDDAAIMAMAMTRKAMCMAVTVVERLAQAEELARQARPYALGSGEESRVPPALAWALVMQGKSPDEVGALTEAGPLSRNLYATSVDRAMGVRLAFRGELEAANHVLGDLMQMAEARADDATRLAFSIQLCEFALRAGDVIRAAEYLDELDQWTNVPMFRAKRDRLQALHAAMRGQVGDARRLARLVLDGHEEAHADAWDRLEAQRALGLAALFEGDRAGAVDALDAVWQHCVRHGVDDPGAFPVAGDLVEVLVDADRVAAAKGVASRLSRLSREQDHPWGLATTKRAQAMVSASSGSADHALGGLLTAAGGYGRLGLFFEQARCLSYASRLQRQSNKRAAARQALTEASDLFERLGCQGWAAKTRSELGRISGRRAADESDLTPSEQRVVELAVGGLSNKEIAKTLFVSVYTVEAHLSHAYAKLGVRSRSQLAGRLGEG